MWVNFATTLLYYTCTDLEWYHALGVLFILIHYYSKWMSWGGPPCRTLFCGPFEWLPFNCNISPAAAKMSRQKQLSLAIHLKEFSTQLLYHLSTMQETTGLGTPVLVISGQVMSVFNGKKNLQKAILFMRQPLKVSIHMLTIFFICHCSIPSRPVEIIPLLYCDPGIFNTEESRDHPSVTTCAHTGLLPGRPNNPAYVLQCERLPFNPAR